MKAVLTMLILALLIAGPGWAATFVDTLDQGQNADGVFDTKIGLTHTNYNYGASEQLGIYNSGGSGQRTLLWFNNWDTVEVLHGATAVIDSAVWQLYVETESDATVGMFELFKPTYLTTTSYEGTKTGSGADTVETGTITWDDWFHPDSAWTKIGADSTNNSGVQNRGWCVSGSACAPKIISKQANSTAGAWTNPSNAYTSNDTYATTTSTTGARLVVGFGTWAIPSDATIDSVSVISETHTSTRGVDNGFQVAISNDNVSFEGTEWLLNGAGIPTSDTIVTITHTLDDWGAGVILGDFISGDFYVGLRKSPTNWSGTGYCDSLSATVYYTVKGADRTATAMASHIVNATGFSDSSRFKIDTTVMRAWITGTKLPWGVVFIETSTAGITIFTSSEGTAAQRPRLILYSTTPGGVTGRRRQILMGD